MLLQRTRGRAPHNLILAHDFRSEYATSRTQHRTRFDAGLVTDPHLSADHSVVFNHYAARESGLCGDDDMPPDAAIVGDVHHVVELGAVADVGDAQGCAIDTGV